MLGNLYVAAKYWAWGYSDGMANAGSGSGRRTRKRYEIDGRIVWAHESELPDILTALLRRPEPQPKTLAKARKQPAKAKKAVQSTQIATPTVDRVAARLDALAAMFQRLPDQTLALALADARNRIEMQEDEDLVILLWH